MSAADPPSFAFPDGVLVQHVGDELVLLDLRTEQYYGLDRIGADMVTRLIRSPESRAVESLCRDYDVDAGVLAEDMARLVGDLLTAGLLERTDAR